MKVTVAEIQAEIDQVNAACAADRKVALEAVREKYRARKRTLANLLKAKLAEGIELSVGAAVESTTDDT